MEDGQQPLMDISGKIFGPLLILLRQEYDFLDPTLLGRRGYQFSMIREWSAFAISIRGYRPSREEERRISAILGIVGLFDEVIVVEIQRGWLSQFVGELITGDANDIAALHEVRYIITRSSR